MRPHLPAEIDRFAAAVTRHLGLAFDPSRLAQLDEVLEERTRARHLTVPHYLDLLESGSTGAWRDELRELAAALTVPETYFFRNAEQIRALQELRLDPGAARREIRILSAGCASGEEAYSLAMAVLDRWPDADSARASILGVDFNPRMLARARAGRYSPWSLRETPEEIRQRWFRKEGTESTLDPRVRSLVTIEEHNLAADSEPGFPPRSFDAIFFRNVVMYFSAEKARLVVARLTRALRPGGLLFLGYAETLRNLSQAFHLRHTHGTFYYQLREPLEQLAPPAEPRGTTAPLPPLAASLDAGASWVEAIQRASDRVMALSHATGRARRESDQAGARASPLAPDLGSVLQLLREERFEDALALLARLPPGSRRDPDVLQLTAALLVHAGRRSEAERLAGELLRIDALNVGAHYVLALCSEQSGAREAAIDHNRSAIHLDPTFSMAHLHLGILAKRGHERELARQEFSQALDLLHREEASRLLLFGGGFGREALLAFCRAEMTSCGAPP